MPYKDKEKRKEYNKRYRLVNREILLNAKKSYWKRVRLEILMHYGNNKLECKCCKEKIYEFLSLDHIHGGGNQHRKSLGSKYIYTYLRKRNYPKGYQVLCHNCNMAKAFYKKCPHRRGV